MLWSLIKLLVFVALAVGLAYGATYVMETGPSVTIAIDGLVEANPGPLLAVLLLLVAFAAMWLLLKVAGFIVALSRHLAGDETAIKRYFDRNRERRGYEALTEAMLALASGEAKQAVAKARKAEGYLRKPELTNLITAQAAELNGDRARAEATYKKLLSNSRTRFVGIRGIMNQKLAEGDTDTAMKLAEKAFALKPKHQEVQDSLLKLQAEKHDWTGARQTLGAKLKQGALPRDLHRRRDAILAVSQAKDLLEEGKTAEARKAAIEANRLSPDLVPAAVMAARSFIEMAEGNKAARVLKKAWTAQPHPELATAFAEIVPDESPADRVKRFEPLLRIHPDDAETKMLRAELLISSEDFPAARRAMGDLASEDPTTRALAIMAAIARGEGEDESVVRGYLARAVSAPRGPQWVCEISGHVEPVWVPISSKSGGFDTLVWRRLKEGEGEAAATGAEMLPLVVGAPDKANANANAQEDTDEVDGVAVEAAASNSNEPKAAAAS
ncbi:MAG: heme biosynthesis HemY N-terminal domain-containing protein [Pseudomonadota bacterium]